MPEEFTAGMVTTVFKADRDDLQKFETQWYPGFLKRLKEKGAPTIKPRILRPTDAEIEKAMGKKALSVSVTPHFNKRQIHDSWQKAVAGQTFKMAVTPTISHASLTALSGQIRQHLQSQRFDINVHANVTGGGGGTPGAAGGTRMIPVIGGEYMQVMGQRGGIPFRYGSSGMMGVNQMPYQTPSGRWYYPGQQRFGPAPSSNNMAWVNQPGRIVPQSPTPRMISTPASMGGGQMSLFYQQPYQYSGGQQLLPGMNVGMNRGPVGYAPYTYNRRIVDASWNQNQMASWDLRSYGSSRTRIGIDRGPGSYRPYYPPQPSYVPRNADYDAWRSGAAGITPGFMAGSANQVHYLNQIRQMAGTNVRGGADLRSMMLGSSQFVNPDRQAQRAVGALADVFDHTIIPSLRGFGQRFGKAWTDRIGHLEGEARRHFFAGFTLSSQFTWPVVFGAAMGGRELSAYQSSLRHSTALTDIRRQDLPGLSRGIQDISKETGRDPKELADALYYIASTGNNATDSLKILERTAKGAAAGMGETKVVADSITGALKVYNENASEAGRYTDILTAAVKVGKGEAEDYAPAIGKVVGMAKILGVSFEEVAANIATMTRANVTANQAGRALDMLLRNIAEPSAEGAKAMKLLGTSGEELRKSLKEKGLLATLKDILEISGGNIEVIGRLVGSVTGLRNILSTAGAQAAAYKESLAAVKNSAGETDRAFGEMAGTLEVQWQRMVATGKSTFLQIAEQLLPMLTEKAKVVADAMPGLMKQITAAWDTLPPSMQAITKSTGAFLFLAGPLLHTVAIWKDLQAATMLIGSKVFANPVVGVTLLAAGYAAATGNVDVFKAHLSGLTDALGGNFTALQHNKVLVLEYAATLGILAYQALKTGRALTPLLAGGARGLGVASRVGTDFMASVGAARTAGLASAAATALGYSSRNARLAEMFAAHPGMMAKTSVMPPGTPLALGGFGAMRGAPALGAAGAAVLLPSAIMLGAAAWQEYTASVKEATNAQLDIEASSKKVDAIFSRLGETFSRDTREDKGIGGILDGLKKRFDDAGDNESALTGLIGSIQTKMDQIKLRPDMSRTARDVLVTELEKLRKEAEKKLQIQVSLRLAPGTFDRLMADIVDKLSGGQDEWVGLGHPQAQGVQAMAGWADAATSIYPWLTQGLSGAANARGQYGQWHRGLPGPYNSSELAIGYDKGFGKGSLAMGTIRDTNFRGMAPTKYGTTVAHLLSDQRFWWKDESEMLDMVGGYKNLSQLRKAMGRLDAKGSDGSRLSSSIPVSVRGAMRRRLAELEAEAKRGGTTTEGPGWDDLNPKKDKLSEAERRRRAEEIKDLERLRAGWQSYSNTVEGVLGKIRSFGESTEEARVQNEMLRVKLDGVTESYLRQAVAVARLHDQMQRLTGLRDSLRGVFDAYQSKLVGMGILQDPAQGALSRLEKLFGYAGAMTGMSRQAMGMGGPLVKGAVGMIAGLNSSINDVRYPETVGVTQKATTAIIEGIADQVGSGGPAGASCAYAASKILQGIGAKIDPSINAAGLEKNAIKAGWVKVPIDQAPVGALVVQSGPGFGRTSGHHTSISMGGRNVISSSNNRWSQHGVSRGNPRAYVPPASPGAAAASTVSATAPHAAPINFMAAAFGDVRPDFDGSLGYLGNAPDWMRSAWGRPVSGNDVNAETRMALQSILFSRQGIENMNRMVGAESKRGSWAGGWAASALGRWMGGARGTANMMDANLGYFGALQQWRAERPGVYKGIALQRSGAMQPMDEFFYDLRRQPNMPWQVAQQRHAAILQQMKGTAWAGHEDRMQAEMQRMGVLQAGLPFLNNPAAYARITAREQRRGELTGRNSGDWMLRRLGLGRLADSMLSREMSAFDTNYGTEQRSQARLGLAGALQQSHEQYQLIRDQLKLRLEGNKTEDELNDILAARAGYYQQLKALQDAEVPDAERLARGLERMELWNKRLERQAALEAQMAQIRRESGQAVGASRATAALYGDYQPGNPDFYRRLQMVEILKDANLRFPIGKGTGGALSSLARGQYAGMRLEEFNEQMKAQAVAEFARSVYDLDQRMLSLGDATGLVAQALSILNSESGAFDRSGANQQISGLIRNYGAEQLYNLKMQTRLGRTTNEGDKAAILAGEAIRSARGVLSPEQLAAFTKDQSSIISATQRKEGSDAGWQMIQQGREAIRNAQEQLELSAAITEKEKARIRLNYELLALRERGVQLSAEDEATITRQSQRAAEIAEITRKREMLSGALRGGLDAMQDNLFNRKRDRDTDRQQLEEMRRFQRMSDEFRGRGILPGSDEYDNARMRHEHLMRDYERSGDRVRGIFRSIFGDITSGIGGVFRQLGKQSLTEYLMRRLPMGKFLGKAIPGEKQGGGGIFDTAIMGGGSVYDSIGGFAGGMLGDVLGKFTPLAAAVPTHKGGNFAQSVALNTALTQLTSASVNVTAGTVVLNGGMSGGGGLPTGSGGGRSNAQMLGTFAAGLASAARRF